jgi:hypothetical protein
LRHLFWNAPARLQIDGNEDYLAGRILVSDDPEATAWAASRLPPSAWLRAAGKRGLEPDRRAFALNLANAAPSDG